MSDDDNQVTQLSHHNPPLDDPPQDFNQRISRTKRDRSRSRYSAASSSSNPNRARKRIRIDNQPVQQTQPENNLPQQQSFTSNTFPSQFQDFSFQQQDFTPAPPRVPVRNRASLTRVQQERPDNNILQNSRNFYDNQQVSPIIKQSLYIKRSSPFVLSFICSPPPISNVLFSLNFSQICVFVTL